MSAVQMRVKSVRHVYWKMRKSWNFDMQKILNHKTKRENFRIPLCEKKENFLNSPFRKIKNCESQIAEKIKTVHTVDYE